MPRSIRSRPSRSAIARFQMSTGARDSGAEWQDFPPFATRWRWRARSYRARGPAKCRESKAGRGDAAVGGGNMTRARKTAAIGVALVLVALASARVDALSDEALVDEAAKWRIDERELQYLRRTEQITPEERARRFNELQRRNQELTARAMRLPPDERATLEQRIANRFAL